MLYDEGDDKKIKTDAIADAFAATLQCLSNEERENVIYRLSRHFCEHCGKWYNNDNCYCTRHD